MEQGNGVECSGRIALTIQYDGTKFNGWQIQNGGVTVQGEIEKAIRVFLKRDIRVLGSGRTDAGVHALGQVAHFDVPEKVSLRRLCIALNGILPREISITNAYRVTGDFHARFGAVARAYRYIIYNHPLKSPFTANRAMWLHDRLDLEYLRAVSEHLLGEMDFASFCKKSESKGINTVRRITSVEIRDKKDWIFFEIQGNGFLHHMVRIMVGTLIEMHRKQADPSLMAEVIAKRDRVFGGFTAPACGLYLRRVFYYPPLDMMDSAF
ncbi:MAG: tRNA pseudouridine(38-40) synthase TruA [Spirochaetes bacterium]|nr:tRNA pseudouridine(38-40) synthase TruA [Spirochaetota bacterium]